MKLVNDLMSRLYKTKLNYYDKKADRLNDKAKSLWLNGKDYHKMENRSMDASSKACDAFEMYYRWSEGKTKDGKELTVKGCSGVYKMFKDES